MPTQALAPAPPAAAFAFSSSSLPSSPFWCICVAMSQPPTNSPAAASRSARERSRRLKTMGSRQRARRAVHDARAWQRVERSNCRLIGQQCYHSGRGACSAPTITAPIVPPLAWKRRPAAGSPDSPSTYSCGKVGHELYSFMYVRSVVFERMSTPWMSTPANRINQLSDEPRKVAIHIVLFDRKK